MCIYIYINLYIYIYINGQWQNVICSKCGFRHLNTYMYKYRHKRIQIYRFKCVYIYIKRIMAKCDLF